MMETAKYSQLHRIILDSRASQAAIGNPSE